MSNSSNPTDAFRFLDLPKEVRFMVYERLPRTKTHHRITLFPDQHPSCVLVVKSIPMSILATCRMIHDEDGPFVQKMARKFVYNTAPKVIMTIDFAAYPETENHRALFHAMIGAIQRYKKHDIYKDSIGTALSKSKITQSCGFKDALMDVLVSQGMINPVMAFIHQAAQYLMAVGKDTQVKSTLSTIPLHVVVNNPISKEEGGWMADHMRNVSLDSAASKYQEWESTCMAEDTTDLRLLNAVSIELARWYLGKSDLGSLNVEDGPEETVLTPWLESVYNSSFPWKFLGQMERTTWVDEWLE
jgi:hypothetical protein